MEIQALKLFVNDADLAELTAKFAPKDEGIEELQARITPEGILLSGKYPTPFFAVSFETLWQVTAAGPEVRVRLANVRVLGLPATMLSGALMKMVRDNVEGKPGVRVEEDTVVINATETARAEGVSLEVKFTAVRPSVGSLVVEAQ
jgi:hypothetical protein